MIETLHGIVETVNYKQNTSIKLYDNDKYEDYPAHWHAVPEIIMPTRNIYTVVCDNETTVLREGDIVLIAPGCIHTLYAPERGRRIIFQPDINPLRFMNEFDGLLSIMPPITVITPEEHPDTWRRIHQLLTEIRDEYYDTGVMFSEISIYSKTLEILTLIGRGITPPGAETGVGMHTGRQEEYVARFMKILDYIGAHCTDDLNLDDVAAMSGFSKFYFSKLFKQFTGVSFYKYVNQKRIEQAAALLTDPDNAITNVALSCGYNSLSSFIRMFKIVKGCTPTEFRGMYQRFM